MWLMGQHTLRLPAPATPHLPAVRVARTGLSVFCSRAHTCAAGDAVAMVTTVASLVVTPNHHTLKIRRARTAPLHDAPWQATKDTTIGCFTSMVQRSRKQGSATRQWCVVWAAGCCQPSSVRTDTTQGTHNTPLQQLWSPTEATHAVHQLQHTKEHCFNSEHTHQVGRYGVSSTRLLVRAHASSHGSPTSNSRPNFKRKYSRKLKPIQGGACLLPPSSFRGAHPRSVQDAVAWPASGWGLYGVSHTCE